MKGYKRRVVGRGWGGRLWGGAGVVYVVTALVVVLVNWLAGNHAGEMGLSVSAYVGLNGWSAVMFLVSNVIVVLLTGLGMRGVKMTKLQGVVLGLVGMGLLGCSIFPLQYADRAAFSSEMHQLFAEWFFLAVTGFFIVAMICSKSKVLKGFFAGAIGYAVLYIILYVMKWEMFMDTIFIWENGFIVLFIVGANMVARAER